MAMSASGLVASRWGISKTKYGDISGDMLREAMLREDETLPASLRVWVEHDVVAARTLISVSNMATPGVLDMAADYIDDFRLLKMDASDIVRICCRLAHQVLGKEVTTASPSMSVFSGAVPMGELWVKGEPVVVSSDRTMLVEGPSCVCPTGLFSRDCKVHWEVADREEEERVRSMRASGKRTRRRGRKKAMHRR